MLKDLGNVAIALFIFYGFIYIVPILIKVVASLLLVGGHSLIKKLKALILLDKVLITGFLLLVAVASSGCSTTPKHVPSWRDAYQNRKPAVVIKGVPLYPEHVEYVNRHIDYMCLAGIKPMLPVEFTNTQAKDFCGCMTDKYYTPNQYNQLLVKLDFNPDAVVLAFKEIQNEYWAVMDDEFKKNYREIVKYPPGYFERITADRANCIDDGNYNQYTKQDVIEE